MNQLTSLALRTKTILQVFGDMIRIARLERKQSQQALAQRLGVSRQTIAAIEKGDSRVAVGCVFEAATIVGIPLLADNPRELQQLSSTVSHLATLLPERSRTTVPELNDDF